MKHTTRRAASTSRCAKADKSTPSRAANLQLVPDFHDVPRHSRHFRMHNYNTIQMNELSRRLAFTFAHVHMSMTRRLTDEFSSSSSRSIQIHCKASVAQLLVVTRASWTKAVTVPRRSFRLKTKFISPLQG
ncbi:hypothetical protein E1B28_002449 [Marasmius oreades]|uniref:Uncharacterized protein n=1 Tax=Marasmius oreades TaxID=181124 RepID=A0A9P7RND3_9AGAR|nr:uncharacterized protein E1B28_002449 [Marasmius oreades]KAG7086497.1 hypothetical protein E1B28_002449 [Marasmius oreades]